MQQSKRDRIAARAYKIWVEEGRPAGKSEEHWRRAEQEVSAEDAAPQMGGGDETSPSRSDEPSHGDSASSESGPNAPAQELDTRPPPPVDAAPPRSGAETAAPSPETKAQKRKSGRSRRPKSESQQG